VDHFLLGKFVVNNYVLTTTGLTPFFINKGYHPQFSIEPLKPINKKLLYKKRLKILLTDQHADCIKNLLNYYKGEMA
jgi:Cft2 family RNA processing exonuclease